MAGKVLPKLDGLSEHDVRRPLTLTGTNLLGLVTHLATWEARYLGEVFDRPSPEPPPRWGVESERLADMWVTPDESRSDVVARYRRVWAHGDATIAALDLDAVGRVEWWGDADILREELDGVVGTDAEAMAADGHDAGFWADHRAQIEAAARASAA